MPAREHTDQHPLDQQVLADDHALDLVDGPFEETDVVGRVVRLRRSVAGFPHVRAGCRLGVRTGRRLSVRTGPCGAG